MVIVRSSSLLVLDPSTAGIDGRMHTGGTVMTVSTMSSGRDPSARLNAGTSVSICSQYHTEDANVTDDARGGGV